MEGRLIDKLNSEEIDELLFEGYPFETESGNDKESERWRRDREQIIREIGFEPGEHFMYNESLSKIINIKKIEFGNKKHIAIKNGEEEVSVGLLCPYKLSEELKKKGNLYYLAIKKYEELMEKREWKAMNILSEGIAGYLIKLSTWDMNHFGWGQNVLYRIVRKKELKRWNNAVKESMRGKDKEIVWYQDIYKFIFKDNDRKDLVRKLCNCLAGVSYAISES